MRKHIILAAMATAALFTACSNETEEAAKQSMEVRFCVTNNNLTTRATTSEADGAYTTTFGTDDPIIIYSSGLKEDMNNVTGKVSGSNVTINGDATYYYKDLTTTATFNAYHPMTATYSEGTVSFTVAANQNENFDNNEFMVATATGKGSEVSPVALSFEHQLALVVLNLSGLDDATEVTMNSVKPTVEYVFGGTLTTKDTKTIDITMNKRGATQTYWAMVPAQTFAKDHKLFTIKTATATYTYTVTAASGLTTTKNTIHTITLSKKLNETQLSASISGWNPIDNWGSEDVEEEVPAPAEPIVLISEAEGTPGSTNVTSIDDRANATSRGWYVYLKPDYSANMTAEYDNANSAYNLNISNTNNWNHRGLCYRVDDSRITASTSKRFKLTIKAYANISNGSLRVCAVNASDFNKFFYIDEQTTSYPSFSITSTSNEYSTLIFDFSKFGAFSSNVFTPIETNYNNVLIYITGINAAGSYFIESISMTEVI